MSPVPALHRLSGPELVAARLDGDLFELGSGFLPADAVETPGLRAATLRGLLSPDLAAVGLSAAWVHLAIEREPWPHLAQSVDPARRRRTQIGIRVRERALAPDDVVRLGGVLVAAPAYALADLALSVCAASRPVPRPRLVSRGSSDDLRDAFRALAFDGRTVRAAIGWLQGHMTPNKRAALRLLRVVADGGSVDAALDAAGEPVVRRR